jgi:concentrative nucleoside transporter, CNT family
MAQLLNGIIGIVSILTILFLLSAHRKRINWRTIGMALLLQITFAFLVIRIPLVKQGFEKVSGFFVVLLSFTKSGSEFLFGSLVNNVESFGFIFVFQVLPTILFFAALTSALYYFGILQKVVFVFAWIMNRLMRLSGAESLAASANVFLGQTEAPLLIRPYIERMTRSETLALMTGGMATIAGGVLAAYVGFLGGTDPAQQQLFATHLLSASIMAAPGSLLAAKLLMPETEEFDKELKVNKESIGSNVLEAISNGTGDGLRLAVNVGAMLLVFTALMAMMNYIFQNIIGELTGLNELIVSSTGGKYTGLSLQYVLGQLFSPIAWLIGIRGDDVVLIGQLLGEKTILNEFFAYSTLSGMKASAVFQDQRSILMATYALCGFANFASIGIQIGGIGALAPGKKAMLSQLGIRALIGGTAACLLNAAIAGMFI